MVDDMAANEETVSIDTVKKTLWDSIEALGENISGETLTALMKIIEGGVFEMNITLSVNSETGKEVVTTDKTAEELFGAIEAGKVIEALFSVPGPDETDISVRRILRVGGLAAGGAFYSFSFVAVDEKGTNVFFVENLSNDDTVVFTQV